MDPRVGLAWTTNVRRTTAGEEARFWLDEEVFIGLGEEDFLVSWRDNKIFPPGRRGNVRGEENFIYACARRRDAV